MGLKLEPRDLSTSFNNLTQDYSSFDRCMTRNYCKIPFIIACVVGGLIVLSLVMCCVRCVMCGYACCSCCCGGCGGRPHRRDRSHKYDSSPPPFGQQQQQPQSQQPIIIQQPIIQQQPSVNEPPQYAYFHSKGDDCLPHMPSLQNERMVESHEMGNVGARGRTPDPYDNPHSGLVKRVASPAPSHCDYEPVSSVQSYYNSQGYNHPSVLLAAPPPVASGVMPQRTLSGDSGYVAHPAPYQFSGTQQYPPENAYDPYTNRPHKEWTAV